MHVDTEITKSGEVGRETDKKPKIKINTCGDEVKV